MLTHEAEFERVIACCFSADDAQLYSSLLTDLRRG